MYLFSDKIIFCSFSHKLIAFLSAVSDFWSDVFFYCRCDHLSIVCLLKIIWLHRYILLLQFLSCCVIQLSFTPKKCVVNFAVLIRITEIIVLFNFTLEAPIPPYKFSSLFSINFLTELVEKIWWNWPLAIIRLILITFFLDYSLIVFGEKRCWSLLQL